MQNPLELLVTKSDVKLIVTAMHDVLQQGRRTDLMPKVGWNEASLKAMLLTVLTPHQNQVLRMESEFGTEDEKGNKKFIDLMIETKEKLIVFELKYTPLTYSLSTRNEGSWFEQKQKLSTFSPVQLLELPVSRLVSIGAGECKSVIVSMEQILNHALLQGISYGRILQLRNQKPVLVVALVGLGNRVLAQTTNLDIVHMMSDS